MAPATKRGTCRQTREEKSGAKAARYVILAEGRSSIEPPRMQRVVSAYPPRLFPANWIKPSLEAVCVRLPPAHGKWSFPRIMGQQLCEVRLLPRVLSISLLMWEGAMKRRTVYYRTLARRRKEHPCAFFTC